MYSGIAYINALKFNVSYNDADIKIIPILNCTSSGNKVYGYVASGFWYWCYITAS
jgi:hypothetical protein